MPKKKGKLKVFKLKRLPKSWIVGVAFLLAGVGFGIYNYSIRTSSSSATARYPCLQRSGEVWAYHAHNAVIRGTNNTCIKHLQDMLNIVHFESIPEFRLPKTDKRLVVDGDYGAATAARVGQFKSIWNRHPIPNQILSGNGDFVDLRTWSALSWICGPANPNC